MNIKEVLQKLYKRIASSGFLKSVLTLSSGVVVAQVINLFGMPVVGRVYTPAAMGDYTSITAGAAVISSVACLGMMTAFMLPKEHEEARGLSRLVTYSTVVITTLAIFGLWLLAPAYRLFATEAVSYGVSLLALWLYIIFHTVSNICYAYVNRHKKYRVMFWNPIIAAGVNVTLGIVFGLLGWGFVGYTAAHLLSFVANIVHLIAHANPYVRIENSEYSSIPLLKSYRRFPLYQMPANLLSSAANQLPVQIIGSLFGAGALGLYSMALKILSLPTALLATPINRVYFQEASQRYNRGEDIGEFTFKILETNIRIAIIPISVLMMFGEPLFAIFLGEQWRNAGTYAAIMGMYQLMLFCISCLAGDFVIIRKNRWNLYSALASLAVQIGLAWFCRCIMPLTVTEYLVALAALMSLKIIVAQSALFIYLKFDVKKYWLLILKYVIAPCVIVWLLRSFI